MANYNTFNIVSTKSNKPILTTSSAVKCKREFAGGCRIDVWNENVLVEKIYKKNLFQIDKYIRIEKEYVAKKQQIAHEKKQRRRERAMLRLAIG